MKRKNPLKRPAGQVLSLDALHKVEKRLTSLEFEDYRMELYFLCGHRDISATAAQRAEALRRVKSISAP